MLPVRRGRRGGSAGLLGAATVLALAAAVPAAALDASKDITEYVLDQWDARHALPFSTVRALRQTQDGYLWLATQSGLVRFDGAQFTVFDTGNSPGIAHNRMWSLATALDGRLWMGTDGGLSSWQSGGLTQHRLGAGSRPDGIRALLVDADGVVWIGTSSSGLQKWRGAAPETVPGLSGDSVFAIAEEAKGTVWIGTNRGLDRLEGGVVRPAGTGAELVWSLLVGRDGTVWVGTEGAGLLRGRGGRFERITTRDGLPGNEVRALLEDRDGSLWVGTNNGLGRLAGGRWSRMGSKHGLSSELVRSLYEDADGNVWIGFYGSGLSRLRDGEFTGTSASDGLVHDLAWGIAEAVDGSLWINTQGGISHLKDGKWTSHTSANGLHDDIARALLVDRTGAVWVGNRGVSRLKDGRFTRFLEDKFVQSMYESRDGSVWFGTWTGLHRWKDGRFEAYGAPEQVRNEISVIHEDGSGTIWTGATRGLSRLRDGRLVPFLPQAPWSSMRVEAIHEEGDGVLWVSTDGGGLFRIVIEGESWTAITARDGLVDDTIFDILEDASRNLWLGGPRGVFRLGRASLDEFVAGRSPRVSGTLYGVAHGMKSSECTGGGSEPGALKDRQGRLWFPTTKGVAFIDPRRFHAHAATHAPLIEEVRFDRAPLATAGQVSAGPGRGDLELRYTTVNFVSPGSLRFRYRLEGFDPAWVEAGDRRIAHFTNLLPGPYRFVVQVSNDGVSWLPEGAAVELRLRPHFYQTLEFRGVAVLGLGFAALGLHRLRVRRLARRAGELLRINEALHESEERYAVAARGANDGLWDWNLRTDKVHYSPRWKAMIGHEESEVGDRPQEWLDRVHPDDQARLRADLDAHLQGASPHFESEHRVRCKSGEYLFVLSRGLVVRDATGANLRLAGSQTDITQRKEVEAQILHDAVHDPLTGFPNRTLFLDRLGQAVARRRRRADYRFAVLFLDLDRFKLVNDSLGHLAGDALLVALADRLRECLRTDDTVARLGGDEFAVLLDDIAEAEEATRVAERIQGALRRPFSVDGHEIFSTASIGITVDGPRDRKPEELLRDADTAMYRAKAQGRDRHETFDEGMHAQAVAVLKLESEFRRGLDRGELCLVYQPIVDLRQGGASIFEALVRWRHPDRGLMAPDVFIPLAEETGLVVPLGHFVLREACATVRGWQEAASPGAPAPSVSVNLSAREFAQEDLVTRTADLLREFALAPGSLKLEITESVIMVDPEAAIVRCLSLRELGVGIAIDDFGTGYSSLSYLRRFPIDALKIDRSFVSSMLEETGSLEIVRAILSLAGTLRIKTVAEGVETQDQLLKLKELGCDYGQGYLFARPLAREEAFTPDHSRAGSAWSE